MLYKLLVCFYYILRSACVRFSDQKHYIKELQQILQNGISKEEKRANENERPIAALIQENDTLKQKQTKTERGSFPSQ